MKNINQRGQSMVISIVFLTVLMGMSALVIDVGAWYRAHRSAQSTADASALAAAQALPDTTRATALANEYAGKNSGTGPGATGPQITFSRQGFETDTVQVTVTKPHPGFFAKLFGLASVNVKGRATARAWNVSKVKGVAPITVNYKHPLLNCTRGQHPTCNPNFGSPTTLTLEDIHTLGRQGRRRLLRPDQPRPERPEPRREHAGRLAAQRLPRLPAHRPVRIGNRSQLRQQPVHKRARCSRSATS